MCIRDSIYMTYYSALGPIDPQVPKDGQWMPTMAYLKQYQKLVAKGPNIATAEAILLNKFDPGELYAFQQACDLSMRLLKKWLSTYKFKNWTTRATTGSAVTQADKEQRAEEIANKLADIDLWHSHGRAIDIKTLVDEINLKIEDYSADAVLKQKVDSYFRLFEDFLSQKNYTSWIQTAEYF